MEDGGKRKDGPERYPRCGPPASWSPAPSWPSWRSRRRASSASRGPRCPCPASTGTWAGPTRSRCPTGASRRGPSARAPTPPWCTTSSCSSTAASSANWTWRRRGGERRARRVTTTTWTTRTMRAMRRRCGRT
ncbi:hypothetical protein COCON_G00220000 [Conger conger]|uniref:Uncharacterized protein n=1 Tax=Conger conger TaxID=82655 RepID=A0A9Q1CYT3_CONCO|nr:hypothetical protein COCON_G00220000 [Conger conger]